MPLFKNLSRQAFLSTSGGAAAHSIAARMNRLGQQVLQTTVHRIPPPLAVPPGIQPMFKGKTARPLRYTPVDRDFVIVNGEEFFNRPLYGRNNDFRVDVGDRPEFSMYLPGRGGNLKFGIVTAAGMKWLADCEEVVSRYRPGRMIYEFNDRLLGHGSLRVEVLSDTAGLLAKVEFMQAPKEARTTWAYAGGDGRKGGRSGDVGCESVPVSQFFQVMPQDCADNLYSVQTYTPGAVEPLPSSRLHSPAGDVLLVFPAESHLAVVAFKSWSSDPIGQPKPADVAPHLPMLTGAVEVNGSPLYIAAWRSGANGLEAQADPAAQFERRSVELAALADTLKADTPDPYMDAGTTLPQLSRVENALATVTYGDGSLASLSLRNPETWWPIDQDYMIDDYMFALNAPLPPRVDLATGQTRVLDIATFKGKGRDVEGGAATIVHLHLDPAKSLASLKFEVSMYPMAAALLAATLVRTA